MKLDALLRAHSFMNIERPPELWEVDTEDTRFVPLLGEMIAAALSGGGELSELTLNASNVSVNREEESDEPASPGAPTPGEYVAVTVSGRADLGPDDTWSRNATSSVNLLGRLADHLVAAGARYAYVRRTPPTGSITVFLSRLR